MRNPRFKLVFSCPNCRGYAFGTWSGDGWEKAVGHCNTTCCGFKWSRKDDHTVFARVELLSRTAYAKAYRVERAWANRNVKRGALCAKEPK